MSEEERQEYVTLIGPAEIKNAVYVTEDGEIKFHDAEARVPAWLAAKLLGPGWHARA